MRKKENQNNGGIQKHNYNMHHWKKNLTNKLIICNKNKWNKKLQVVLKKNFCQVVSLNKDNVIKSSKLFVYFNKIAEIYEANEALKESENCKLQQITAK